MIDPAVRIVDVDPDGFAALCASLAQRDRSQRREVSIVHRDGVVRRTVATFDAASAPALGERIDDAAGTAHRVHAETGADIVTVVDENAIADLSPRLTELARSCRSQGELLWRARVLWQDHPGVVTVPEPSTPRWPVVADAIAEVPDGHWVVLESTADDRSVGFRMAGKVVGGLLVTITSDPDGPVALVLRAPAPVFEAVLRAEDPWGELRQRHRAGAVEIYGFELLAGS